MDSESLGLDTEQATHAGSVDDLARAFEALLRDQFARIADLNAQLASLRGGRGLPPQPPLDATP